MENSSDRQGNGQQDKKKMSVASLALMGVLVFAVLFTIYQVYKPLPKGLSYDGEFRAASNVEFIHDTSWIDENGDRQTEQAIFDAVFAMIEAAEELILIDMFLFNDFQGPNPETTRALSGELTAALMAKKESRPDIKIVVISDPINTLYGGMPSDQFERLRGVGIPVVLTKLPKLRDSNAAYSFLWRIFLRPFGNSPGNTVANPIGPGKTTLRSYLTLANFKANHRKTIIADNGATFSAMVSSANPHDASSAHRNAAVKFDGLAVADLLKTENAVLNMSGHADVNADIQAAESSSGPNVRIVTEHKIEEAVIEALDQSGEGDSVNLMMFYLSDRNVIKALKAAQKRGADIRVLLDFNKDAFGREKNGVPNRPVAAELVKHGISVRWCKTDGEQCHDKFLIVSRSSGEQTLISGSANFTRRNLNNLNLETDVVVAGKAAMTFFQDVHTVFDRAWDNTDERTYSMPYDAIGKIPWWQKPLYRFMEWSGMSTF